MILTKYAIIVAITLLSVSSLFAQNLEGYDEMCNGMVTKEVPLMNAQQLKFERKFNDDIVILDAREKNETAISHIKGSKCVGYEKFSLDSVANIPKDAKVVVYCSIGYRSGEVGEKLKKAGFEYVYNLKGGIFNWANNGYELIDNNGSATTKVHGYDSDWGKWINEDRCTKVIPTKKKVNKKEKK